MVLHWHSCSAREYLFRLRRKQVVVFHWPIHSCFFSSDIAKNGHSKESDSPLHPKWTHIVLSAPGRDNVEAQVVELGLQKVENKVS